MLSRTAVEPLHIIKYFHKAEHLAWCLQLPAAVLVLVDLKRVMKRTKNREIEVPVVTSQRGVSYRNTSMRQAGDDEHIRKVNSAQFCILWDIKKDLPASH